MSPSCHKLGGQRRHGWLAAAAAGLWAVGGLLAASRCWAVGSSKRALGTAGYGQRWTPGRDREPEPSRLARHAGAEAEASEDAEEFLMKTSAEADAVDAELMKKVFFQLDIDGNGRIDMKEFNKAISNMGSPLERLPPDEIAEIFKLADSNGDGMISQEEFEKWISTTKQNLAVWQLIDANEDAEISLEEWRAVMNKIDASLSPESVDKAFRRADRNKSGRISFLEFFQYMNAVPQSGFLKRAIGWVNRKLR